MRKDTLGKLDITDRFFESLREDYREFDHWFNRKADESVYVCRSDDRLAALLYLKPEAEESEYSDIAPSFLRKKRLKIGTFKITLNGFRLGERFLKIVFDNAMSLRVEEIYTTTFTHRIEQQRLVGLLTDFGFRLHGRKTTQDREEHVLVRDFTPCADLAAPGLTYPYFSTSAPAFIVPIYPEYHTELFPDSILKTESPADYEENEPHRNAIRKVYISRSIERNLGRRDVVVFYRTGGYYKSVVTTIGIVEEVISGITNETDFIRQCRRRSVFTDGELASQWRAKPSYRPFIVNFLYAYSLPKRINLERLIGLGVIADFKSAPRGFTRLRRKDLESILKESQADARIAVD